MLDSLNIRKFARYFESVMKKYIGICFGLLWVLTSCNTYNKILKSTDYEYKYEAAKEYYMSGKFSKAVVILDEMISIMKGTDKAEETLFMAGMCYYGMEDYETASHYFTTYYNSYPRGVYAEEARYYTGKTLYMAVPEPRLDQTATVRAIKELQLFLEYYPQSKRNEVIHNMLYDLQNNLAQKEYETAKLYYNLGSYTGNFNFSTTSAQANANNYESCVITAQNALKDYPYCLQREEFAILILRAKYQMAVQSVDEKKHERMRDVQDEYYAFKNDYPESQYMDEANQMMKKISKASGGKIGEE